MKNIVFLFVLGVMATACAPKPVATTPATTVVTPAPAPVLPPAPPVHEPEMSIEMPPGIETNPNYAGPTTIQWAEGERLMPILEQAQAEHKPVFVVFHASWCAPCKVMEEEVFTQAGVYQFLNERFINFYSDYDSEAGKTIASIFEVSQLPTVLFVLPSGVAHRRYTGIISPVTLRKYGEQTLAAMK